MIRNRRRYAGLVVVACIAALAPGCRTTEPVAPEATAIVVPPPEFEPKFVAAEITGTDRSIVIATERTDATQGTTRGVRMDDRLGDTEVSLVSRDGRRIDELAFRLADGEVVRIVLPPTSGETRTARDIESADVYVRRAGTWERYSMATVPAVTRDGLRRLAEQRREANRRGHDDLRIGWLGRGSGQDGPQAIPTDWIDDIRFVIDTNCAIYRAVYYTSAPGTLVNTVSLAFVAWCNYLCLQIGWGCP